MPLKQSEAIVLRTYPLRESDLLVTLFTRAEGKVKGVARAAKKSKRRFGGALEPLTLVRVYYDDREGQELARLDSCDILDSPLSPTLDYPRVVALEHVGRDARRVAAGAGSERRHLPADVSVLRSCGRGRSGCR